LAGTGAGYPAAGERKNIMGLLVGLLVVWAVLIVLGVVIKSLFWLLIVGIVLFVATGVIGFVKRKTLGRG
jgi:hypothetical protein